VPLEARRPQPGDAPLYDALFGDPVVAEVLLHPPAAKIHAQDLEDWERDGWAPWVWFADGEFVGRGGLERTAVGGSESVEVLYALLTPMTGRGYATEIARRSVAHAWELGLPEVVGFAWTRNPASIRVLEKAGLVFEHEIEHAGLPHWFGRLQRPV
jgi:RimJ/RimL family protein N-acetyltransferase